MSAYRAAWVLCACMTCDSALAADSVDSLAWLAGCWARTDADTGSGEQWTVPAGGTMLGVSRTVRGDRTIEHEFVVIRAAPDGTLVYRAHPSGHAHPRTRPARRAPNFACCACSGAKSCSRTRHTIFRSVGCRARRRRMRQRRREFSRRTQHRMVRSSEVIDDDIATCVGSLATRRRMRQRRREFSRRTQHRDESPAPSVGRHRGVLRAHAEPLVHHEHAPPHMSPPALTRTTLLQGVEELVQRDRRMAGIVERYGPPPLFSRPRGFPTLVWIILEQQVSLASAAAMFDRLRTAAAGEATPEAVSALGVDGLLRLGVTRQKARYVNGLAERIVSGEFDLRRIAALDDGDAERALLQVPGIGPWTAGVYLLMALRRPDIWPPGDLGLHKSLAEVRCLREVPSSVVAADYARRWRPWRAVAARLLWHSYLARRRKPPWGEP